MNEPVLAAWRPCANNQQFRQSPQNTREVFGIHVKFHTEFSALWSKVRTRQMHHRKTDREFCIYVCGNIDFIRRYTQTFYADVYRCNREHRRLYAFSVKPSSRYKAPSRRSLGWSGSASRHNPRGRGGSHIALRRPTRRLRSVLVPAHARRVQTLGRADHA